MITSEPSPSQISVLVIDDEYGIRDMLEMHLEDLGWQVDTAENGSEALKIIQRQTFDLIISDIKMPGCDGVEILKQVKRSFPTLPVILMTGFSDYSEQELLALGAHKVFKKPFILDDLTIELEAAHQKVVGGSGPK